MYGQSFPQPWDVDAVEDEEAESDAEAVNEDPPAVSMPRSMPMDARPSLEANDTCDSAPDNSVHVSGPGGDDDSHGTAGESTSQEQRPVSPTHSRGSSSFITAAGSPEYLRRHKVNVESQILPRSKQNDVIGVEIQQSPTATASNDHLRISIAGSSVGRESLTNIDPWTPVDASTSMASLLPHDGGHGKKRKDVATAQRSLITPILQHQQHQHEEAQDTPSELPESSKRPGRDRIGSGLVRFNVLDRAANSEARLKSRLSRVSRRSSLRSVKRGNVRPGEIVKLERMLVRVDSTMQTLPDDYDENDSLKADSRIVEKWREYVVVCRESTEEDVDFSLQMYKTRVSTSSLSEAIL
jgi:hypothetical protein